MHDGLASWPSPDCFQAVPAFLRAHHAWVAEFCASAPQTNEVRRAAVLFAGLQYVLASLKGGPASCRLLELGSSAGLNLSLHRCVAVGRDVA